jgi:hypothetical protein
MKRFVLLLLLLLAGTARAQQSAPQPGQNLHIYLMTFGPGDDVWERFGHNALWVQDETFGIGVAYNWGMFSFQQPHFIARFVKGQPQYWMAGYDAKATVDSYIAYNRSIWVQELNLTPAQRLELAKFLEWNARDENRFYRYDYFRDNCSTRVRDAIDRVTGGAVARSLKPIAVTETYRSHTAALTYHDPMLYSGLMLAMGPNIDAPLTAWTESFIPMQLREWVRKVKIRAPDGTEQPLILSERTLFDANNRPPVAAAAPNMTIRFIAVGCIIAGLLLLLAMAGRAYHAVDYVLAFIVGIWCLVVGLVGLIIELLWAFTDHVVTYNNENVLQANWLSLLLLVFAVASLVGAAWARRWAVWLSLFVAGLSVLGFLLQILPGFNQVNGDVIGLMMPVHGAVAYILWRKWRVNLAALPSTS